MADPVARQERDPPSAQRCQNEGTRGGTKGRVERHFLSIPQLRHVVQPAAADDPDLRSHPLLLLCVARDVLQHRLDAQRLPVLTDVPGRDRGIVLE